MEVNKFMSFDEFCEMVKAELFVHMSERFRNDDCRITIFEKKDSYEQSTTYFRIENINKKSFSAPEMSLDAAYENYKKLHGDKEKILALLGDMYEKLYVEQEQRINEWLKTEVAFDVNKVWPMELTGEEASRMKENGYHITRNSERDYCFCLLVNNNSDAISYIFVTEKMMQQSNIDEVTLYKIAEENVPGLLPLYVESISGSNDRDIKEAYFIRKETGTCWEMYGTNVYEELADRVHDNLIIIRMGEDCIIVTPAESVYTLEECTSIAKEMASEDIGFEYNGILVYDRLQKTLLSEDEKMEECIKTGEYKKHSIFNRNKK